MRLSTYDPDDPISTTGQIQQTYNSVDNSSVISHNTGQRVSTISTNYTEKTMLLSSDEEN